MLSTNVTNLQTQSICAPTINQPCIAPKEKYEKKIALKVQELYHISTQTKRLWIEGYVEKKEKKKEWFIQYSLQKSSTISCEWDDYESNKRQEDHSYIRKM